MGTRQFIQWLKDLLDKRKFTGCVWVDKEQQVFKIAWPRADKSMTPARLGVMFSWWTHKFGNTKTHNQPTAIKGNFRSCLNSKVQSLEIKKLHQLNSREGDNDWKFFQFTNPTTTTRPPPATRTPPIAEPPSEPGGDDTAKYEPHELYAWEHIDTEYPEVLHENRRWQIAIRIFRRGGVEIGKYIYDYMNENRGQNKIHIFVEGFKEKVKALPAILKHQVPNVDHIVHIPIDPKKSTYLSAEFPCPSEKNPNKTTTMSELFCPGFIMEVDNMFNIYITRLSRARMSYGHHGETNTWQKLNMAKPGAGETKQLVFSYTMFVHREYVYNKWLDDTTVGKPKVDMIHPMVLIPVSDDPALGQSYTSGDFFFEIEHLPAQSLYKKVMEKQYATPIMPNISEDPNIMSIIETNLGAVTIKDYDNGHEVPGPSFIPPPQHLTPQVSMDSDLLLAQVNVGQSPQSFVQSPCHSFIQSPHSYIQSPPQEVVEGCEEELDDYNITSPLSMYSSISSAPSQTVSLGQEALQAHRDSLQKQGYHAGNLPCDPMFSADFNLNNTILDVEPISPFNYSEASTIRDQHQDEYQSQSLM